MAASVANVASAFKDTGIFHLGESAVPEIFFHFVVGLRQAKQPNLMVVSFQFKFA